MKTTNSPRLMSKLKVSGNHCTFGIVVRRGLPCPVVTDDRDIVGVVVLEDPLQTAVDARHVVTSGHVVLNVNVPYRRAYSPPIFLTRHRIYVRSIPMFILCTA